MKINYWVKRYKYKFYQKQLYRLKGISNRNFIATQVYCYVLKSLSSLFLVSSQIEAGRRVIRHFFKKFIKIYINLLCNKSISSKAGGVRMGKGKGHLQEWVHCLKAGELLYSVLHLNNFQAYFILMKAKKKFNFRTFICKVDLKTFYY